MSEQLLADRHEYMYRTVAGQFEVGARVLDVGCGEGYGTAILARHGLSATGVDVEPSVIEAAVRTYTESSAEFARMESHEIPFDADTFDGVTAFHVIEHVEGLRTFVEELARVLKPGGRAFVTTPNRDLRLEPGERPWNRYHVTEFDGRSLEAAMNEAFDQVIVRGVDVNEPARSIELRRVGTLRKLGRIDPLGLRRFVPQAVIQRITAVLTRSADVDGAVVTDFEIVDVSQRPIDLLAICSRSDEG